MLLKLHNRKTFEPFQRTEDLHLQFIYPIWKYYNTHWHIRESVLLDRRYSVTPHKASSRSYVWACNECYTYSM